MLAPSEAGEKWAKGELTVDLLPQGSMAEMIRAGGMGIPGILTATGIGTLVEESPWVDRKMTVAGKDYLLMKPIHADFAVISGYLVDKKGNIWYKGTTRIFNRHGNGCGYRHCGGGENCRAGRDSPKNVATPGILVDYIVLRGGKRQWISREPRISLPAAAPQGAEGRLCGQSGHWNSHPMRPVFP